MTPIAEKEREHSKDLPDSKTLHDPKHAQPMNKLSIKHPSQADETDRLEDSLPEISSRHGTSELAVAHDRVIEDFEHVQDCTSPKRKKPNKHRNRGKNKKMEVDYRLKGEYWPGLL